MNRIVCAPHGHPVLMQNGVTPVSLYHRNAPVASGTAGAAIQEEITRQKFQPSSRAWDFLSFALSVVAADHGTKRQSSPDGWTRQITLKIAVSDPAFWQAQRDHLQELLGFLTTDLWELDFVDGGAQPPQSGDAIVIDSDTVALLSGGMDSLIGGLDLHAQNVTFIPVSHVVRGDRAKQIQFAQATGQHDRHVQLNHNVDMPHPENPPSDRARSIIFYAYAIVMASCTSCFADGRSVRIVVPENGLISLNPPLTPARIGSLSTRTTHPYVIKLLNEFLSFGGFNMTLDNPYQFNTKGEMLHSCQNQSRLQNLAHVSTSCGRIGRYGGTHCGKCLPCLIRRAAFLKWGQADSTDYHFRDLSQHSASPHQFDDVRSAALAVLEVEQNGVRSWARSSLNSGYFDSPSMVHSAEDLLRRGTQELGDLLRRERVL